MYWGGYFLYREIWKIVTQRAQSRHKVAQRKLPCTSALPIAIGTVELCVIVIEHELGIAMSRKVKPPSFAKKTGR